MAVEPQKTANPENITGKPPVNSANSLQDGGNLPDRVQHHADAILRASGSGLRNYSMESTKRAILSASLNFAEEMMRRGARIAQQETERATVDKIVAWLREVQADHETRLNAPGYKVASSHHADACKWAADAIARGGRK